MKKLLGLSIAGLVALAVGVRADLLTDGGFDSQPTWGGFQAPWWSYGEGAGAYVGAEHTVSSPNSAAFWMSGDTGGKWGMVGQTVPVTEGLTYQASVSFYRTGGINNAYGYIGIEWYTDPDGGGSVIGEVDESDYFSGSSPQDQWVQITDIVLAPAGAESAKFTVVYKRNEDGTAPPGIWVDDASFAAIPEPSVMLLLGGGLLGLIKMCGIKKD